MTINDSHIRCALKNALTDELYSYFEATQHPYKIVEEWGVNDGEARVDVAVINGVLHGYEIKSDKDTLLRLPHQIDNFNSVFDQMTLVVGKNHLYEAFNLIPEWWGVTVAKFTHEGSVILQEIRCAGSNPERMRPAIARLLWRDEALQMLEEIGADRGVRSKPRNAIYERLASVLEPEELGQKVRSALFLRRDWKSDQQLLPSGG